MIDSPPQTNRSNSNPSGSPIRNRTIRGWVWFPTIGAIAALFLLQLSVGSVRIPLNQVMRILVGLDPAKPSWKTIVMVLRLPRALTALLAGAGLAVSGLQMQTLFRNPLAGPSILGIGAGASLGVALVILTATANDASRFLDGLGLSGQLASVAAAGAGAAFVLILVLAAARKLNSPVTLLILGLLFGYATNAIVSVLLHFSIAERIQVYVSWTFGSFGGTTWRQLSIFIPIVGLTTMASQLSRKSLNGLLLGDRYATSMGVRVGRARATSIATTAILTGAVTAFCGPIGFLGVAVPHLCRALFLTSDHRVLLPATAAFGAVLALISDLISQVPGSQIVLPLNAVTAIIGAPVVGWIIIKRRALGGAFAT